MEERLETDPARVLDILCESISIISQEVENLQLLAQDFSNYARINQPDSSVFDAATAVSDILKSYLPEYDIQLDLASGIQIDFDKTHFYQIITNLLQNAIDASQESESIQIQLYREHSYAIITIQDQGKGISPQDLERIFEPYFSRKSKGTGLGLALVKKLCEANNTIIRVKSKPEQGSSFTLIIEAKS